MFFIRSGSRDNSLSFPYRNTRLSACFYPAGSVECKKPSALSQERVCEGDDTKVTAV